jgi:hypothetical protein
VLDHQYRDAARAFARYASISSVPRFAPEGLVLGAGTVLLPADAPRRLRSTKGYEALLLTRLSAAYRRVVEPAVLGNIERAARAWNQGDDCLAYTRSARLTIRLREVSSQIYVVSFLAEGFFLREGVRRSASGVHSATR